MRCAHLNIETNALCICAGRQLNATASPRLFYAKDMRPLQNSTVFKMCYYSFSHFILWLLFKHVALASQT